MKIVITGAAGLLGQNLIPRLKKEGLGNIIAIDKHSNNINIMRSLHTDIEILEKNLADGNIDYSFLENTDVLIVAHAQIGGLKEQEFIDNNITATKNLFEAAKYYKLPYIVQISSSVVNSLAKDYYTETKKDQEKIAVDSQLPLLILRPTLMYGWFDRKHLGWLARFMAKTPIFPIPSHGKFLRQPLYVGDFSNIIISAIKIKKQGRFNISGLERIHYIDLIKAIKKSLNLKTMIVNIPYPLFWILLKVYSLFDKNPPFTTMQLKALIAPDVFEVINWDEIFGIKATSLSDSLHETFHDEKYSKVILEF